MEEKGRLSAFRTPKQPNYDTRIAQNLTGIVKLSEDPATRRSEFAAILKSQGVDGLIAALNRKSEILTATTAKAS